MSSSAGEVVRGHYMLTDRTKMKSEDDHGVRKYSRNTDVWRDEWKNATRAASVYQRRTCEEILPLCITWTFHLHTFVGVFLSILLHHYQCRIGVGAKKNEASTSSATWNWSTLLSVDRISRGLKIKGFRTDFCKQHCIVALSCSFTSGLEMGALNKMRYITSLQYPDTALLSIDSGKPMI